MNHTPAETHAAGLESVGHVVPVKTLLATCIALMVLTAITVGLGFVPLGNFNVWIALFIATIKATLVCMFFMHLRWDRPFNVIVMISAVCFLLIFLGGALTDTSAYNHEIEWTESKFRVEQRASSPAPAEGAAPAASTGQPQSPASGPASAPH